MDVLAGIIERAHNQYTIGVEPRWVGAVLVPVTANGDADPTGVNGFPADLCRLVGHSVAIDVDGLSPVGALCLPRSG